MKDVKIIIDGKEYVAQMSDEQVKDIAQQERAQTGYERGISGEIYYAMSINGIAEYYTSGDKSTFAKGNYVNDRQLCQYRFRARVLHDRLEQWQALHDEPVDWGGYKPKYRIEYDYYDKRLLVIANGSSRTMGTVYFSTDEKAQEAIEVFRDELVWYFTEYRSRLDEKRTRTESEDEA